jgi:hypothetical protein
VCARTIEHTYALEELDSSYDNCGTGFCDRPDADVARGCPDCLVTTLLAELRDDCLQQFDDVAAAREHRPSDKWPWTFERLQQDVAIISNADASVGNKGHSPSWTVRTRSLVSILRDERYKAERARMKEITSASRRSESE